MWFKVIWFATFDNMAIIHWVKNRSATKRWAVSSWDTIPWCNFCEPHWELICWNNWCPGTLQISTPPEIAVEIHFHAQRDTDGEASWSLPSSVSILSGGKMQSEKAYSCIFKVTGQVWESQKRICVHLYMPSSSDLIIKSDSVLTNPVGKGDVWG